MEKHEEKKEHHSHDGHHAKHNKHSHDSHKKHEHAHKEHHKPHTHHHKTAHRKKKTNYTPYVIGAIVVIVIIALLVRMMDNKPTSDDLGDTSEYGESEVTFYVMSQCPYGIQVENAIEPVLEDLGSNIDFRLEFIAAETPGGFQSLHGQPEVDGNMVQLCVQEHYPDELIEFVVCQNKDPRDLKANIDKCAKDTSIDAAKIKECADGEEGASLLSESLKKAQAVNAQGSPTIYIDGQIYTGARDSNSFRRVVCQSLEGHPLCEGLPACTADVDCKAEPGKIGVCNNAGKKDAKCTYKTDEAVELTVINAKECTSCDTTQLVTLLGQVFLNMDVKEIDASSSEGRALIKKHGIENAPGFVFSGNLVDTYAWGTNPRIQSAFEKDGDSYVMLAEASGSKYILDPAKRAAMEKLTGVKKGDNRPQIDFYVMSYCPYGNIAEESIEPAYRLLKDSADFNPHYVIYSNYQGGGPKYCLDDDDLYCSMHGVQELNQGLRELCVAEHLGMDAYFDFTLEMNKKCNSNNADTCWEDVSDDLKLDTAKIKSCEKNEWEEILSKELQLNKALGVSGSPTIFVEGQAYAGARAASGYAQALCAGFETKPDECSASSLGSLGNAAPAPAASAGGCG